ncbi:MAG: hypothetical protein WCG81_09365 [Candidatus Angelobacter sp.]
MSTPQEHWGLALRVAFRFCVAYFTLFGLSNQILGGLFQVPKVDIPELSGHWPLRQITFWTAALSLCPPSARPARPEWLYGWPSGADEVEAFDRDKFTLVNRGFHWINEYPFQR